MVIKTKNFRKYRGIINLPYDKTSRIRSFIYLDFTEKSATVNGEKLWCSINIDHDDTEMDNVFVSTPEFMALCYAYEEITITKTGDKFHFSSGTDTFQIQTYIGDAPDTTVDDLTTDDVITTVITKSDVKKIKQSIIFVGDNTESDQLNGIKIHKFCYTADGSRLFSSKLSFEFDNACPLDKEFSQILGELQIEDGVEAKLSITGSGNVVVYNEDIICISSIMTSLSLLTSDFEDEDFKATYDHDNFIVLDKETTQGLLGFFAPFVVNEKNERMILSINRDPEFVDVYNLSFSFNGLNIGSRQMEISSGEGFEVMESVEYWVSRPMLIDAVNVIDDTEIVIQLGDQSKAAFNVTGLTNKDIHVSNVLLR